MILTLILGVALITSVVLLIGPRNLASRGIEMRNQARVRITKMTLRQLHVAVNQFYMDSGRWPTQAEGLSVLVSQPAGVTNWPPGGYIETEDVPKDGWGRDFIFILNPGDNRPFIIKSLGADGAEGGDEYDADMFSADGHDPQNRRIDPE